ncbi:MAG TPA: dihydroorotate dehydrogenase electron transfer subunit [Candidatus Methanoperedens sp.]|nr:dihydroorotate dehydrogenase electron transfer subunit [Candidatus Methanoperedens sp.]
MLLSVRALRALSADFRLLELRWPAGEPDPLPGQFVMVRTREGTDPLWRRPFGVHDFRGGRGGAVLSLLFQVVGPTTRDLAGCAKGDSLDVLGPHGRGFSLAAREHWLVAGGRGLAPLFYLARLARRAGLRCRAFVGGREAGHVLRVRDLERLGCEVEVSTDDGSLGRRGKVTDLLGRDLARASQRRRAGILVSACGPQGMLATVAGIAAAQKVAAKVSVDPLMACGRGLCLGCTVRARQGYRLACQHGPVFDAADLSWEGR